MKIIGLTLLIIGFMWIMLEITVVYSANSYTQSMWHQKNLTQTENIPRSEVISALASLTLNLKKHQSRIFLPAFVMLLGGIMTTVAKSKNPNQSPS